MEFRFADTEVSGEQLLDHVRRLIERSDFGLYDITGWNANVALELGLALALGKKCRILFSPGRGPKAHLPANVQGKKRIQYRELDGFSERCLTYQLNHTLVMELPHVYHLHRYLRGAQREKRFTVAMRILAHFKGHRWLHRSDVDELKKGSRLQDGDVDELLVLLRSRGLIAGSLSEARWEAGREFYQKRQV